jgi:hypothetical protein
VTRRTTTSVASVATHELLLETALAVRMTKDLLEQRTIIKEVTGLTAKVANTIRANSSNKLVRWCKTGRLGWTEQLDVENQSGVNGVTQ